MTTPRQPPPLPPRISDLKRREEPEPDWNVCARCARDNPHPDDPNDLASGWEYAADDCGYITGVICPDCVTPAERQALYDSGAELDRIVKEIVTPIPIEEADGP
jgi:hypothetical protein